MNFLQAHKQDDITKFVATSGSKLLSRYQNEWNELHQNSVNSCNKAKELSQFLLEFSKNMKLAEEKIKRFYFQLQVLPDLVSQVDVLASNLEKLEMSLLEVSCSLDFYEKVSQEHDQCNQRQEALSQVNELRMHKRQELEGVKSELARKHAEMLSKIQTRQQSVSAERQKFIIDAITSKDID